MGRWSRLVASRFVAWLDPPPGAAWLEIGCGTGALTATILERAAPASLIACDPSDAFVAHARRTFTDARVSFVTAGAEAPPARDGGFDSIVSGLVLNFVPDPAQAVRAMRARLRAHGVVAAYVWDYAGRMDFLRIFWEEAVAADPRAAVVDERHRFPLCTRDGMERTFADAGARGIRVDALDVRTAFSSFDDYWRPFTAGVGPAPAYVVSLDDEARTRLHDRLEARLARGGGAIELLARAWAARGSA